MLSLASSSSPPSSSSSSSSSSCSLRRMTMFVRSKLHLMTWSPRPPPPLPSSAFSPSSSCSSSWFWWWLIGWLLRVSLLVVSVIVAFHAAAWYYSDEYYLRVSIPLIWPTPRATTCSPSSTSDDDRQTAADDTFNANQQTTTPQRINYIASSMSERNVQSQWDRTLNHSVAAPFQLQWFRGYNVGLTHNHHHLIAIGRVSSFNLCHRKPPGDGSLFYAYTFACRLPLTDSTVHFYGEHERDMFPPSTSPHSLPMLNSPTFICPSLHYALQPFPPTICEHKGSEDHRYFTFHNRVYGLGQYWSPSYECEKQLPIIIEYDTHSLQPILSLPIRYQNSQRLRDHDKNWVALRPVDRELDHDFLVQLPELNVNPRKHEEDESEDAESLKWYLWVMRSPLPLQVGVIDIRSGMYTQLDSLPHDSSNSFEASAAVFDCYPHGISGGTNSIPWHFHKSGVASHSVTGQSLPEGMRYDYLLMVLHEKRVQWRWPARYYYHALVLFDARPPFIARRVSLPFEFGSDDNSNVIVFDDGLSTEGSLQYAVGLAYANKAMSELLISYGEDDCHSRFAQLHVKDVERLLGIPQFR